MTLVKTYAALPLSLSHAEDVYVWDTAGKKYLDLYAGHAVCSTGHCHPDVVKAIQDQAAKLIFYSNVAGLGLREEAAAKLCPPGYHALFANSGAEANEDALKLARKYTGRDEVVAMIGGFHGRTAGAVAVTGIEKYRVGPQVPGVRFVPFGEVPALTDRTAAVILEPIQSMAGVKMAKPEYYQALRAECDKSGALLIYDEVQTGIGRTGTMFFSGRDGVHADLITLAKGIASGIPLSAVLVKERISETVKYGDFGHTFGAGPIAMAALKATVSIVETLLPNVRETGAYLAGKLAKVGEVRGLGFLTGLKLNANAATIRDALLARGVIVGTADEPGVLRLLPPLTLRKPQVDEFVGVLDETLHQHARA
jgi:acetylornithine/succinyldiaminopimelate/putrescine aminotransferase